MTRGGARANAGRKPGSGRYGFPTVAIRVPKQFVDEILYRVEHMVEEQKLGLRDSNGQWVGMAGYEEQMKKENKNDR